MEVGEHYGQLSPMLTLSSSWYSVKFMNTFHLHSQLGGRRPANFKGFHCQVLGRIGATRHASAFSNGSTLFGWDQMSCIVKKLASRASS